MTRLGFLIMFAGAVLIGLGVLGVIDSDLADIFPAMGIVIGALAVAVDGDAEEEADPSEKKEQVPLGGGGRLGPLTRIGFAVIAAGVLVITLRVVEVIDTEMADISSVLAIVIGALVVAVDGEREIRVD